MLIRPDSRAGWWPFQSAEERKHINSVSVKNLTATIEEEESRAAGASKTRQAPKERRKYWDTSTRRKNASDGGTSQRDADALSGR